MSAPSAPLGPRFWRLWAAVASSNLGDGLVSLALPWLASLLTRDPLAITGVALATRLPWLLLSLHAGALGDRLDRRRLLVGANTARAVIATAVTVAVVADLATLPMLYVAAFLLGVCEVVFDSTSQTVLPSLVPATELERANGRIMGAQLVIADLLARPLAGALVGVALSLPFAIDAVTAAVSAALVAGLPARPPRPCGPDHPPTRMGAQIRVGLRWLWEHRLLRSLALTLGVLNATSAATMATFVLFAQELLRLDGLGFGLLLTAGSVGGLTGSLVAERVTRRIGPGATLRLTLAVPVAAFAVTAVTSRAVVAGTAFAVVAFTAVLWNVVTVSLRQRVIPDHLLGRVNSVYRFLGWGAMPVGTLAGGALVEVVSASLGRPAGLRAPFAAAAVVSLAVAVVVGPGLSTSRIVAAGSAGPT